MVKFNTFCVRRKGGGLKMDDFVRIAKIAKTQKGGGGSKNGLSAYAESIQFYLAYLPHIFPLHDQLYFQ